MRGIPICAMVMCWATLGACVAESGAPVQPPLDLREAARREEAGGVLDDFHHAADKSDFARYFSHWTTESVFLGTDATERWVGDEFKAFAKPHFDKGKGWTYRPHQRHVTLVAGGRMAFFDELLDNEKLGLCRGSGVLVKQGEDWKILQYNLSIPIPNEMAEDTATRIRALPPPAAPKR